MSTPPNSKLILYRLLGILLSPAILIHLLYRTTKDGGIVYLKQRLGFSLPALKNVVWFHAASVGEINTLSPLLELVRSHYPVVNMIVTTNTPTGKETFRKLFNDSIPHCYLPLDYFSCVRRFIKRYEIKAGIITETEIWPVLISLADFPVCIVNARLSDRTLKHTNGIFKSTYSAATSKLSLILARSSHDAAMFESIGANRARIKTIGNLKYANLDAGIPHNLIIPPLTRRYCLLASTHEREEELITSAWLVANRQELLVIAPRHPERRIRILAKLETLTQLISIRSQNQQIDATTKIYLADTLGEMSYWYQYASAIFMGGSLAKNGGHNILEPAHIGKAVVTGPNYSNFQEEVNLLKQRNAIEIGEDANEVVKQLLKMLDTPKKYNAMGNRAKQIVQEHSNIKFQYLSEIRPMIVG